MSAYISPNLDVVLHTDKTFVQHRTTKEICLENYAGADCYHIIFIYIMCNW